MNTFDKRIHLRQLNDEIALQNAFENAVNAIVGESFSFDESKGALFSILHYYKLEPFVLPDDIQNETEKLNAFCRLSGLMQRTVRLTAGWYRNSFGAYLCKLKETGKYVAVVQDKYGRYSFYHEGHKKHYTLNKKTEKMLEESAICFYKSLPQRKLKVTDLLQFAFSSLNAMDLISVFAVLLLTTGLGLLTPKLTNFLFSTVVSEGSYTLLFGTMIFLIAIALSTVFLNAMKRLYTARITIKTDCAMRSAGIMRLLSLPPDFFRRFSTGELNTRIGYIGALCSGILSSSFLTILSTLFSLAYLTQIYRFTPSLLLASVVVLLLNGLYLTNATLKQVAITHEQVELSAKENGKAIEMIGGMRKIKTAGAEKRVFANYSDAFSAIAKLKYNPPVSLKYTNVLSLAITLASTLLFYVLAMTNGVSVPDYYTFTTSYAMITSAVNTLVDIVGQTASFGPALEMIQPILRAEPETTTKDEYVSDLKGEIELTDVSFRYEGASSNVISNLSLKINPGEYVAVVGKSGCGKSTLLRILLGFEKPQLGAVYYDGRDLEHLDKRSLRRKIGTVMQDDKVFNADIYSNIVICAPTLSMESAWESAELAGIADDIREMPMGMQTLLTEGSGGVSGGQKQRIVIARAIATKPKILLFDEATSALDNLTQKKVADSLAKLHCTRVVVAHRLSTVKNCDRIIVLDKGSIADEGTYDELMERNEFFRTLVARQQTEA